MESVLEQNLGERIDNSALWKGMFMFEIIQEMKTTLHLNKRIVRTHKHSSRRNPCTYANSLLSSFHVMTTADSGNHPLSLEFLSSV